MTICVYSQGVLYADRAGVGRSNIPQFVEMKKLFISPCKRFAMVVSGDEIDPKSKEFKTCIRVLTKLLMAADALSEAFDVTGPTLDYVYERSLMIMTTRNVYTLRTDIVEKKPRAWFVSLDKNLNGFIGSGRGYASIAMQAGKTPLEAIRIASLSDSLSYLTAIDQVAVSDLIPF